ncbi:uncharacterized protein MONBRDRAFT_20236 [Monosiga brevicollis MX1]|uniref:MYG1 protein n=1 Tax=Monosiga brevicollis TaxID=81824 RepID=A9UV55_MONBE|nr:uncharacterized protein MONBRDRAFT_20236 [Monosiga brevicollis MX1]EDQ90835.1 predicted protein [Monosiga brevicollis MX1]|eukprot:XP_001744132.1 hypothetical protein [Monosiga brevicollis MX1]
MVKIGTHDGTFHCDEALACFLLKRLPEYQDAEIVRTRDLEKLKACDIVVDVGAVFDPATHRYDHHQREFQETMTTLSGGKYRWSTRLSSAGLVYYHFGKAIIAAILPDASAEQIDTLFSKMYGGFVEEIDAVDNGVSQYEEGSPKYHIGSTVSTRVGRINPSWKETDTDMMPRFERAMALVGGEFVEVLKSYYESWLPARDVVKEALETRFEVDPSGEIIKLPIWCPWKSHLYDLEAEMGTEEKPINIKYALYVDSHNAWRVLCASITPGSFVCRKALPEAWRGLRDADLEAKSGIAGATFVHASGFTGGNKTYEGALAMAKAGLEA